MAKKSNSAVPDVEISDDGFEGGNATPHDGGFSLEPLRTAAARCRFDRRRAIFADLLEDLLVRIMLGFEVSDEITEQTILLLKQLSRDDVFAVHLCVEGLLAARTPKVEYRGMAEVIEKFDAILAVLVPWLKRNGMSSYGLKRWPS
jgi:hypothetical protein